MSAELAVVTGASRGIGRATALALAARGLDVALLARDRQRLEAVAAEVRALGVQAHVHVCDVADSAEVTRVAEAVLAVGTPRAIVNNAGNVERVTVEAMSDETWRRVLGVNLDATFFMCRAFLPAMRARGRGRFVQIASISSTLGTPRLSAYCAAKWGVVGFTQALAEELRKSGLQTMAVLPGSVDTTMLQGSGFPPEMQPEDVAKMVVFAALDAPDASNGASLPMFGP